MTNIFYTYDWKGSLKNLYYFLSGKMEKRYHSFHYSKLSSQRSKNCLASMIFFLFCFVGSSLLLSAPVFAQVYTGGSGAGSASQAGDRTQYEYIAFTTSPEDTEVDTVFTRQPVIKLYYGTGAQDTSTAAASQIVNLSIYNNAGNGALSGTTALTLSSGQATATDLSINKLGELYTLLATPATKGAAGISNAFNIVSLVAASSSSSSVLSGSVESSGTMESMALDGGTGLEVARHTRQGET